MISPVAHSRRGRLEPLISQPQQSGRLMAGSAAAGALMHPLQALQEKLRRGRSQRQPSGRMFSYSRLSDAVRRRRVFPSQMPLQSLAVNENSMLRDSSMQQLMTIQLACRRRAPSGQLPCRPL